MSNSKTSKGSVLLGLVVVISLIAIASVALGVIYLKQLNQQRNVETQKRLQSAFQAMFPYPLYRSGNMWTDFSYYPDSTKTTVQTGFSTKGWYLDGLMDRLKVGASDPWHNPPQAFLKVQGGWNGPYWQGSLDVVNNRPLDAWGRPIQLRYVTSPQVGFQVFSLGANGLDDTAANSGAAGGDDLVYPLPPYTVPIIAPHWQKNGTTQGDQVNGYLLTTVAGNQKGAVFWSVAVNPWGRQYDFDIRMGLGTGADGMAIVFADTRNPGVTPGFVDKGYTGNFWGGWDGTNGLAEDGSGGISAYPGAFIAFDTYKNGNDPSANFVGLGQGGWRNGDPTGWVQSQANATYVPTLRTSPSLLHVRAVISADGKSATITLGPKATWPTGASSAFTLSFTGTDTFPSSAYLGFTGSTGGSTDEHYITNLTVTPPF